ncbi:MAG: VUT family protein [Aestuariivirga sp.]
MNKITRTLLSVGAYIAFIVLVNELFTPEHLIEGVTQWSTNTWMGTLYLANVIVGFVFVLRDYAQREIGHKVLLATALAGLPVWYFAGPELAIASLTAFALSEMTDWAIYTFTQRPLQNRILISALFSVPVDTLTFQHLAGYLTPAAFVTEVLSKAVGVAAVWYLLKLRVGNAEVAQTA